MFDFGIDGYQPTWLRGLDSVTTEHGDRLAALVGRTLTDAWLAWDRNTDDWFADCPVLLDFDGEQVELNHWKFDELSITWNTVDPESGINWGGGGLFNLRWRNDLHAELVAVRGRTLTSVELLEWAGGDMADGTVALDFRFADDVVRVFNAFDENGLDFTEPRAGYRRIPLA